MEHSIIISLAEYNEIKDIKNNFKKAFDENKMIIHRSDNRHYIGHSDYEYNIVNESEVIKQLHEKIVELQNKDARNSNELNKLKDNNKRKKRWFQF